MYQPGSHPLGFQLRNIAYGGPAFNPDYGISGRCAPRARSYGRVTERVQDRSPSLQGGRGLANASHRSSANITRITDQDGNWRAPLSGGAMTVKVSGLNCPAPRVSTRTRSRSTSWFRIGFELNTPLEEVFSELKSAGITYTTYLDYSKGRTLMHTLKVSALSAVVRVGQTPLSGYIACTGQTGPNYKPCTDPSNGPTQECPLFQTLKSVANNTGALAVSCGVVGSLYGRSLGYLYPTSPPMPPAPGGRWRAGVPTPHANC